jgi:hypothetical protein
MVGVADPALGAVGVIDLPRCPIWLSGVLCCVATVSMAELIPGLVMAYRACVGGWTVRCLMRCGGWPVGLALMIGLLR